MGFFPRYIMYARTNKAGRRGHRCRGEYRNIVQIVHEWLCVLAVVYTCVLTVWAEYYTPYNMPPADPKVQRSLPKYFYLNFFS